MATLAAGALVCGNFSDSEIELIGSDPQAMMHVLAVDNTEELSLLKTPSQDLAASETSSGTFRILCARMLATVNDPGHPGVGIAAPQVGILKRVIAVQRFDMPDEPFIIYVNPRIVEYGSACRIGTEGCLSVPNLSAPVGRAESIVITYLDPVSETEVRETVAGFTAVIFQHEIDHLDGIIFTERIVEILLEQEDAEAKT